MIDHKRTSKSIKCIVFTIYNKNVISKRIKRRKYHPIEVCRIRNYWNCEFQYWISIMYGKMVSFRKESEISSNSMIDYRYPKSLTIYNKNVTFRNESGHRPIWWLITFKSIPMMIKCIFFIMIKILFLNKNIVQSKFIKNYTIIVQQCIVKW